MNSVGTGYFETHRHPARARPRLHARRHDGRRRRSSIVNETMARAVLARARSAIGKRFKFFGDEDYTTVIGVARDSKYNGVAEEPQNFIYQPLPQNYTPQATLHVRTGGDAASLASAVRAASAARSTRRSRSSTCARSRSRSAIRWRRCA